MSVVLVVVSLPPQDVLTGRTPVLIDDIVSTARTMCAAVQHLTAAGGPAPICIGVHALFVGDAYAELTAVGAGQVLSCDTVRHASNRIGMADAMAAAVKRMLAR